MTTLMTLFPLLLPLLMGAAARRIARGRVQRHPEHAHAVVLACRYTLFAFFLCFGMPLAAMALILGASWGPFVALVLGVLGTAAIGRGSHTMDRAMERRVHTVFGGLAAFVASGTILAVLWMAAIAAGVAGALSALPGGMVLAGVFLISIALCVFCVPVVRNPSPPRGLAQDLDVDPVGSTATQRTAPASIHATMASTASGSISLKNPSGFDFGMP